MESIEKYYPFDGKVFGVVVETFEHEDGKKQRFDLVTHTPSYGIVATPENDSILLVKQYRHGAGQEIWEIPAGMAEKGEHPGAGAHRELQEETGFFAKRVDPIFTAYSSPGYCDEKLLMFHAYNLRAGQQNLDEDEKITWKIFTIKEACDMIATGEICDMKSIAGIYWLMNKNRV